MIPEGYKLNKLAPISYRLSAAREHNRWWPPKPRRAERRSSSRRRNDGEICRPARFSTGKGDLKVTVTYGYCRDGAGGLCKLGKLSWLVPIEVAADAKESVIRLSEE